MTTSNTCQTMTKSQAPSASLPSQGSTINSQNIHWNVLAVTMIMTGIGLLAIFAASSLKGSQQFGDEFLFLRKQSLAAALGLCLAIGLQFIPLRWLERATLPILVFAIALLALIFVPGMYVHVGGASRWLNLPIVGGQPAEITKLALVLFLAKNLSRPASDLSRPRRGLLPNLMIYGLVSGLLLVQRDLGTPVLLFGVTFCMLFVAGLQRRWMFGALALFGLAILLAVLFEPYRMARVLSFLDPWSTFKGSGFQIIQSFVAFQNGGLLGVGLGESKQKLFFLPEAHTDFVLAVIGEEMGLLGVMLVCGAFLYFSYLGFKITKAQPTSYRRFMAFGVTTTVSLQACLNMGVCMGLLPTKGMTLPFISSGNSSLLVFLVMAGILARLARDIDCDAPGHSAHRSSKVILPSH